MVRKLKYISNLNHLLMRGFPIFLCILFFTFFAVKSSAQQSDSLKQYLKIAEENNPGIKAKILEYSAAMEKVPQVGSLPDPQIDAGFYLQPMAQIDGNLVASFKLMQMFPWFGTLKAAKDEMTKMAMAKFEEVRSLKNQLFLNVKTSYFEVYRTKKKIDIISKNLEILRTIERLALVKFKAGEASGSTNAGMSSNVTSSQTDNSNTGGNSSMGSMNMGQNSNNTNTGGNSMTGMSQQGSSMGGGNQNNMLNLLRIQIEIGSLEEQIEQFNEQLVSDKVRFNSYLNRSSNAEVFVIDSIVENKLSADLNILADSIVNNPMIRMFETDKTAYEARIKMITKMSYPMFGIGIDYSVYQKRIGSYSMMNGDDMFMPMITVTLPIYRKKYNAQRREAEFMRDASAELANNMKNELKISFQDAVKKYKDAGRKIILYKKQAALTEKSISLLLATYTAAGSDFDEILRMHQQSIDFQLKNMEAIIDKNIAIATIEYVIAKH